MLALLGSAHAAFPADSPSTPTRSDPVMERYHAAAQQNDWKSAAATMQAALSSNPNNADYHSLYAYSLRKSGTPDMDQVFKHYNEALRLDPKHRGAHEYLGEAYLQVGNVAKAKEHLAQLDKLCFFGCSEFNDLKRAISEHEAKTAKQ
ncbi:MAG TPA: tetratricopeptide repeat protein [Burkholderiales bacterium]|nr:tetratricopeptide repeat protein [Burkholderiales bacterium]